jgi:hypothetical protein
VQQVARVTQVQQVQQVTRVQRVTRVQQVVRVHVEQQTAAQWSLFRRVIDNGFAQRMNPEAKVPMLPAPVSDDAAEIGVLPIPERTAIVCTLFLNPGTILTTGS